MHFARDYYDSLYASGGIETQANHKRRQHQA
jgi:hypothetical protein